MDDSAHSVDTPLYMDIQFEHGRHLPLSVSPGSGEGLPSSSTESSPVQGKKNINLPLSPLYSRNPNHGETSYTKVTRDVRSWVHEKRTNRKTRRKSTEKEAREGLQKEEEQREATDAQPGEEAQRLEQIPKLEEADKRLQERLAGNLLGRPRPRLRLNFSRAQRERVGTPEPSAAVNKEQDDSSRTTMSMLTSSFMGAAKRSSDERQSDMGPPARKRQKKSPAKVPFEAPRLRHNRTPKLEHLDLNEQYINAIVK